MELLEGKFIFCKNCSCFNEYDSTFGKCCNSTEIDGILEDDQFTTPNSGCIFGIDIYDIIDEGDL